MQTEILRAWDADRDAAAIARAAEILQNGGLVAFPTETVYGIGANALDPQAVARIFEVKGRPQDNPLIVHIPSIEAARPLVREISHRALTVMEKFWPGPLSVILPKSDLIPGIVSAGLDSVALRMPSHPVALALLRTAGVPVAAPSANRSGTPSCTSAEHCIRDLDGLVDAVVDGGLSTVGLESTVLSLTGDTPRILRPGGVSPEQLAAVLGELELDPSALRELPGDIRPASPGMKYRHYAPRAEVVLLHGSLEQFLLYAAEHFRPNTWAMVFEDDSPYINLPHIAYGSAANPATQAKRLFSALRELDDRQAELIFVRAPAHREGGIGLAVYNRLLRAAAFREVFL